LEKGQGCLEMNPVLVLKVISALLLGRAWFLGAKASFSTPCLGHTAAGMVVNTISVLEVGHILNFFSTSPGACSCDSRGAFYVNLWTPNVAFRLARTSCPANKRFGCPRTFSSGSHSLPVTAGVGGRRPEAWVLRNEKTWSDDFDAQRTTQ